ncbi:MAG: SdrD B-like domain-containing protein [Actinomycetota bacterium]|nr:SdrD B-like domain-containing protein [Actinomycetota bacterium]MDD5666960.1 SdrD B-like domain-containing protein [Actinomycetota bacterium]
MRRATKWLVFMLIVTMLTASLLAGAATALAQETEPAAEPEEAAASSANIGVIEALVWDDSINPDNDYSIDELVDGIAVELYSAESAEGPWALVSTQKSGPGGFIGNAITGWFPSNPPVYQHGWVGWRELPVRTDIETYYRLVLVEDGTYKALNGTEREAIFRVNWGQLDVRYYMYYYPMAKDVENSSFQIKSTTATIAGDVWSDASADLIKQWAEKRLEGWTVVLTNWYGRKIASTTTNANGYYQFRGLSPGTYKVWVVGQRKWKQVAPYYKLCTWPPYGCEKGHYTISASRGKYYFNNDFGMLDMRDSIWATLYYGLWWIGLLQYQFTR